MNNIQKIKNYIQLAKPSKLYTILQFAMHIGTYLLSIYFAIPSANAITCITVHDLNGTIYWLVISCIVIVLQQFLQFCANRLYYKHYNYIWQNVHSKIFDKVNSASNKSFTQVSKETIINTVYNNMDRIGCFVDDLATHISYFVQAIISIIILLSYNLIIGFAIVVICIVLYFVLDFINKKIGYLTNKHYAWQDKSLECLSDSYTNQQLSQDLNLIENLKHKYLNNLEQSQKYKIKYGKLYSVTANWIPFCYKAIIFALSVYMVYLTKANVFTLTLYLVLTNYLTKAISQMVSSYSILDKINSTNVACLRVKNILDMKEEDLIEFGNNDIDEINGEIIFTNVSYNSKNTESLSSIDKFNLKINKNSATLFYGNHKCGKRAIFYLLNRSIKPTTGTITIDKINIYDFNKESYKHNVAVATHKEYFYNDTIMNNLLLSGANKSKIYSVCKDLGLHQKIVETKNSYNTNLHNEKDVLNSFDTYLLGVARALCTNSEIIILYDFPTGLSSDQKDKLQQVLKYINTNHTLIVFAYNDWAKCVCKNVYKIEKNTLIK